MSAVLKAPDARLRPMVENDLMAIMDIERRAYEFPWTLGIFRDCLRVGYCCWVYERGAVIEGYGVMSVAAGESHILNLCVRPESQGKGVGRRILAHLMELARRHEAQMCLLEVRPSNAAAVHLYESMGFNEVGVRRNYYPSDSGREDALILACALT
ncbi:MAG TPA: ribosomal protein S18-alanine N-acetyltransferase [Gammaproteobacteria bacterium]|nr:ribosomal protein S18-alanine N-acetyltransferase [Gammaproteobacteria bacterium]